MLDLRQLRYFVTVAETGHVGKAAEILHISQSPLSRQIQQLEQKTGLVLFERRKQRIFLTAEGSVFLDEARKLLAQSVQLEKRAASIAKGEGGILSIGYVEGALHSGVLRRSLHEFRTQHPALQIHIERMRSSAQFDALLRGEIDAGFVYGIHRSDTDFEARTLLDEPFILAVPADHPLASSRRPVQPADLMNQPFICPHSADPAVKRQFLASCVSAGFIPDIQHEATEPSTAIELVGAGLGMALVQKSICQRGSEGVVLRPLRFYKERLRISVVRRANTSGVTVSLFK